jgi:alpha-glucosidase
MAEYTQAGRLHMGYSFELLTEDFSAAYIRDTVRTLEAQMSEGWPCWAISNHDVERVLSRWGQGPTSAQRANLLTAMVCSLRGSVCIYQGEELGLTEAEVPFESLRDPYGVAFWPQFKGRDGCRTPMPWRDEDRAGFSSVEPWLPVPAQHRALAVERQEVDPQSALQGFRRFMQWRRTQPALRWGDIRFLDTAEPLLAFTRSFEDETVLVAFNLADQSLRLPLPLTGTLDPIGGHGLVQGTLASGMVELPAHGVLFGRLLSVTASRPVSA